MALRLRRGTDAERLLITPAQGELIYTVDTKQLYAGDGTTAGGTLVSSSAATSLEALSDTDLTGKLNGQVLSWNASTSNWEPTTITTGSGGDGVVEGSNYRINIASDDSTILVDSTTGTFTGDLKGSVFGDDSTPIVDAVNNTLNGTLTGVVINSSIDDSFINNTIIGNTRPAAASFTTIEAAGNITGNLVGNVFGNTSGRHDGFVDGDLSGSVFGNDSTLIIDGMTNQIFGELTGSVNGNVTGTLTGDIRGSVFADDSTLVIDGVSGTITGDIITSNIAGINEEVTIESPSIVVTNAVADANPNNAAQLRFTASKGTLDNPETVALGDSIVTIRAGGWNGSNYSSQAGINFLVSGNTIGTGNLPGKIEFFVLDDNDTYNTSFLRLESTGVLTAAALQSLGMNAAAKAALITKANAAGSDIPVDGTIVYDTDLGTLSTYHSTDGWNNVLTANLPVESSSHFKVGSFATGSLPSSPSAGMIAFDSTTNEFKGYNGTAWVVLG